MGLSNAKTPLSHFALSTLNHQEPELRNNNKRKPNCNWKPRLLLCPHFPSRYSSFIYAGSYDNLGSVEEREISLQIVIKIWTFSSPCGAGQTAQLDQSKS